MVTQITIFTKCIEYDVKLMNCYLQPRIILRGIRVNMNIWGWQSRTWSYRKKERSYPRNADGI
jgi:hypothetical protein